MLMMKWKKYYNNWYSHISFIYFQCKRQTKHCSHLKTYIQSTTVRGIITAMSNSSVDEISYGERIKKNGIKIQYLDKTEKVIKSFSMWLWWYRIDERRKNDTLFITYLRGYRFLEPLLPDEIVGTRRMEKFGARRNINLVIVVVREGFIKRSHVI